MYIFPREPANLDLHKGLISMSMGFTKSIKVNLYPMNL